MLRKSSFFLGAFALSLIVLTIVGPKAAQAVTAALVQIVNTPANPVYTLDPSKTAGQMVQMFCATGGASSPIGTNLTQCYKLDPATGVFNFNSVFPVPAGQNLVITTLEVPAGYQAIALFDLPAGGNQPIDREVYNLPQGITAQFQYPGAGIVFSAGSLVMTSGNCFIYGYLTAN